MLKKVLKWVGIAFLAFFCFRLIQFGFWIAKNNKEEKAKLVQMELAKAKREAEFKAMSPEQHLEAAKTLGFTAAASRHLAEVPEGFSGKAELQQAFIKNAEAMKLAQKKAQAEKDRQTTAELKKQLAEWKKQGVQIGMPTDRVILSSWGKPNKINKSRYADGIQHEQWCYSGGYLYFEDGILTGIQN
jgi:hypothetical protein